MKKSQWKPCELTPGCKINLCLKVGARRADGFHSIDSIFYPLSIPADKLIICPGDKEGLEISTQARITGKNILQTVYETYAAVTGFSPPLKIQLKKGIPIGSGLGGGSSDAASLLIWLNNQSPHPVSLQELAQIAASIGSDIPFFLINAPARVEGKGEIVTPIMFDCTNITVLLIWPEIFISSAWAYKAFDELKTSLDNNNDPDENLLTNWNCGNKKFIPCAEERSLPLLSPHNDLEKPVFSHYPELKSIKEKFLELGAIYAGMSGSGSTMFGMFIDPEKLHAGRRAFFGKYRHVYMAPLSYTGM